MIHGRHVYIATGEDPEFGEGPGCLWCIDATKRGDVSPEVVVDRDGRPVPPRRIQAADPAAGDLVRPNPQSAAVWRYVGRNPKTDGRREFEDVMHRTLGMAAVKDDLLLTADQAGVLHCLDARSGRVHWTYDMKAAIWSTPLIADGKIYLGDEDGEVAVFELSATLKLLAKNNVGSAVYTTPIVAGDTLYVATSKHLIAIKQ
jgi:outer membrane protein assembly factor BamB